MSEEQKPDTIKAVANAIQRRYDETDAGAYVTALDVIAAHNEELERQGFVVVKPVKMKAAEPGRSDQKYCNGYNDALEDVHRAGAPIEVTDD